MIVITSIFEPTPAVEGFAALRPGQVIVIGDLKTPSTWKFPGVQYVSVEEQRRSHFQITDLLPWNHYSRKNIGYLLAIAEGADVICESDDDNLPYGEWSFPPFQGTFSAIDRPGFVNVYRAFTSQHVWPRGLPLDSVLEPAALPNGSLDLQIGIWQGLADGDPDVDAIYRLTRNEAVFFNRTVSPFALTRGTYSPFNSQNTSFRREVFPLLYMPSTVSFRFTDILRGYIAQPILWAAGFNLGITGPTVFQDRNEHDYTKDFISEGPCFTEVRRVVATVERAVRDDCTVEENLFRAYSALVHEDVVAAAELEMVQAWLSDLAVLGL